MQCRRAHIRVATIDWDFQTKLFYLFIFSSINVIFQASSSLWGRIRLCHEERGGENALIVQNCLFNQNIPLGAEPSPSSPSNCLPFSLSQHRRGNGQQCPLFLKLSNCQSGGGDIFTMPSWAHLLCHCLAPENPPAHHPTPVLLTLWHLSDSKLLACCNLSTINAINVQQIVKEKRCRISQKKMEKIDCCSPEICYNYHYFVIFCCGNPIFALIPISWLFFGVSGGIWSRCGAIRL